MSTDLTTASLGSSQAPTDAVDKSLWALNTKIQTCPQNEFDSQRLSLIAQWVKQTGQAWPMVENKGGQLVRADAHHVIPVTNAGPTQW